MVDPSAPDEPTAPLFRIVYARNTTATVGETVLSSTGEPAARFDEPNKETQSFSFHNPRFRVNVPTVNLPSSAEEVKNSWLNSRGTTSRSCSSKKILTPSTFQRWKTSFKTSVCSCSIFKKLCTSYRLIFTKIPKYSFYTTKLY